jgi:hypothetical protein
LEVDRDLSARSLPALPQEDPLVARPGTRTVGCQLRDALAKRTENVDYGYSAIGIAIQPNTALACVGPERQRLSAPSRVENPLGRGDRSDRGTA